MKKKVVFIEPRARANVAFERFLKKWPLLGPVTMGTMLHQRGHDVMIYSENLSGSILDNHEILDKVLEADFVGVAALTPSAPKAYEIAEALKSQGFKGRLAIGGPHVTFLPEEAAQHFPHVIKGEGESVIVPLVEDENVSDSVIQAHPVENLDELPTPELNLMHDHELMWKSCLWKEDFEVPVSTSRGCIHGCKYCSVTQMYGHKLRMRSVEKVYEDIMHYYNHGYRSIFFYDDNFTSDRDRARRLLELIEPLGLRWDAQCRIDFPWKDPQSRQNIDYDLMEKVKSSGGHVMYVGYETIDEETAKGWNKGYRGSKPLIECMEEDTKILHDYGIFIHGMFVIGPQHGLETYDRILQFANRNKLDSLQMSILTPFPGTEMMDEMRDLLIFDNYPKDWQWYDGAHATFHHKLAGNKALQEVMFRYHKKFYHGFFHQRDRLRQLFLGRGGLRKSMIRLLHSARQVWKVMKGMRNDTEEFIAETARRGEHYLFPEKDD